MPQPLEKNWSAKDATIASILSAGSAIQTKLPRRLQLIGNSDQPSYVPVRWRHDWTPAQQQGRWTRLERRTDLTSAAPGSIPARYGQIGILNIDRETADRQIKDFEDLNNRRLPTYHAVAYKLGRTSLFGASTKYEIFGLEHDNAADYQVAMRIGKDPLQAQVGFMAIGWAVVCPVHFYCPITAGVRPGPVLPESELPSHIPLV